MTDTISGKDLQKILQHYEIRLMETSSIRGLQKRISLLAVIVIILSIFGILSVICPVALCANGVACGG